MEEIQVSDLGTGSVDTNVQQPQTDKVFTRDQVAKIVNAEKSKAVDATKRELEQKYQRDMEQLNASRSQQPSGNNNSPNAVDTDAVYQKVQERFNQQLQQEREKQEQEMMRAHVQSVSQKYLSKVAQGKSAYDDFDEVTKDFDPAAFPQLAYLLAENVDNAHDVLYDISKNPLKIAGLDRLAEKNPRQAIAELQKLSQSITANKQAQSEAQDQQTAAPLDRLQASRVSGSNGKQTIKSLRSEPWLRG
jgi:hypothetical protein